MVRCPARMRSSSSRLGPSYRAVRLTPDQERRLAEALQALLAAAQGETMQERVASAVDVREWIEVHYEVTRPGGTKQRWSSKTGLSGGERRLVVLAPMLAAIAAGYDRFGSKAFRLVTLDEVPAEVDERGREGWHGTSRNSILTWSAPAICGTDVQEHGMESTLTIWKLDQMELLWHFRCSFEVCRRYQKSPVRNRMHP
jgi:hypothetical protein